MIAYLDLDVPPGSITALLGPTGSGKSTLLKIVAGLVAPTTGHVHVSGLPPSPRERITAYMPQSDTLLPWRRALDNALLGIAIDGPVDPAFRSSAEELFERFGLGGFERAWPHELSGGMRQRVALARTVLADRAVLLLDEPFGALDPVTRGDLQTWLSRHLTATKRTALIVTHDVDEALDLATDVVVLSPRPARIVERIRLVRKSGGDTSAQMVKQQLLVALAATATR